MEARADGNAVLVRGPEGTLRLPAEAAPLTWWNPARFNRPLFDNSTGKPMRVQWTRAPLPGGRHALDRHRRHGQRGHVRRRRHLARLAHGGRGRQHRHLRAGLKAWRARGGGTLRVVLGDQCSRTLSALRDLDPGNRRGPARRGAGRMHLCPPPQAEDRAGALRHAPLRPGAGRARRAGGPRAAGGRRQHRHPCGRGGAGRRAPPPRADRRHPPRRVARARRHARLGGADRPAGRDPRRRPLHLPPRLVPGLGADRARARGAGRRGTPPGILLPRHAPQHRPPDGGRQPGRRALELRHREPPPPARPLPRPGAAPLPAGRDHPRGDRDRGAVLPRPFRHPRRLRLAGHGARRATGARRFHRQPPAPLRRLPGRHGRRRTDAVPRPRLRQPQRRPAAPARLLRGGGGGVARRPRAAERRRGLHPPDPRLARVRPRHLLAHHAGLRGRSTRSTRAAPCPGSTGPARPR